MPAAGPQNTRAKQRRRPRKRPVVAAPRGDVGTGGGYRPRKKYVAVADPKGVDIPRARKYERKQRRIQHDYRDTKSNRELHRGRAESQRNIREARRKVLARRRQAATRRAIENFALAPFRAQAGKPRKGGRALPGGSFTPPPSLTILPTGLAAGRDLINFPKNAALSGYETGRAAYDLVGYLPGSPQRGSTKRAKRLISSLDEGALGRLVVHGDVKGAYREFQRHPFYSALEVAGAGQVIGRAAGAGARFGAAGPRMAARANTRRADLRFGPAAGQRQRRSYSANLLVQELQRATDRGRARRGYDPNVATGKRQSRLLDSQVDEFSAQAEGVRRRGREETMREGAAIAPARRGSRGTKAGRMVASMDRALGRSVEATALPGRLGKTRLERDVVLAAVEGRLHSPRTFKRDLTAERDRLQRVYREESRAGEGGKGWSKSERQANRAQVAALDRVLGDKKALANAEEVFRSAEDYKRVAGKAEKELIAAGALDKDQALAAKLRPYAVSQMGARHDPTLRAPEAMAARHEQARGAESKAKETLEHTRARVKRLAAQRDRLVGRQQVTRGRDQAKGPQQRGGVAVTKREADRRGELSRVDRALKAAKLERRAAEAKWKQARRDRVASDPKKYPTGLVDANGRKLSNAQILEHMRAHPDHGGGAGKVSLPGFVSHRRDVRGSRSFFVNWFDSRKTTGSQTRTGEATRIGAHDATFRALEEHLVRSRGVVDAIKSFDDFVGQLGVKRSDGKHYTWDQALEEAEDWQEAYGVEMVPVRAVSARYDERDRARILENQGTADAPSNLESLVVSRLDDARRPPEGKERGKANVVLVPAQQMNRFREHQTIATLRGGRVGQVYTRLFRTTVLPFSTKWLFGNHAEAALRSAMYGITPMDMLVRGPRFFRAVKEVDEELYKALDTRARGGLLYGSGDRLNVYRSDRSFEKSALETPAKIIAGAARAPIIRQIGAGLGAYTRAVFALNRSLEARVWQTGVAGKFARKEVRELTGSWGKALRLQKDALEEIARGQLDTPKQVQLARYTDEVLGKYNRFSPDTRRIVQTIAPFLPWFLNAARFVYWTLPTKHPAKAALMANVERTMEQEFKEAQANVPPGDLESAIPLKDGGLLPIARYTPFGAFTNLPEGILEPFLPQITTLYENFHGRSFTGKQLKLQSGEEPDKGKRVVMGLYAMLEGAMPGLSIARRAQEHGETPFDDSTVLSPKTKPGTSYGSSAADRILNPLRPTYLSAPQSEVVPKATGGGAAAAGLDEEDMHAIREQVSGAGAQLDEEDMEEIRRQLQGSP